MLPKGKDWRSDGMTDFVNDWNSDSFLTYPVGPLGLIALPGTQEIGAKVNSWLKKWRDHTEDSLPGDMRTTPGFEREDFLVPVTCPRFGNGEGKGMIQESIRGYDIYILCDVGAYAETFTMFGKEVPMSPDDHFINLKRIITALGGKAKRVSVIMPMLYEARQHKRTSRESLDCAIALQELINLGVNNIITFDAHDPRVLNAIPTAGFESIMPSYQVFKALLREEKTLNIDKDHMMVVSPDEGAIDRNIYYASVFGLNMGLFYKRRDFTKIVDGRNPIVAHEYLGESVDGKDIFVSDDIISTGESLLELALELKKRKAGRIFMSATFPLFTSGLDRYDKAYRSGVFDRVISTNLTYVTPELRSREWFVEADMSKYISYVIATLNHDRSLSKLLNPYDRMKALLRRYEKEQRDAGLRIA